MKNFGLIGLAGFVASRHLNAIKKTNNTLLAAMDKFDSVGIIDSFFPGADFFTEFERFDRHLEKLKYEFGLQLDYISVCTPNYLHDAHVRFALRHGAEAICEKPLVLNPWNVDKLAQIERESGKRIWNILQSRLHPSLIDLKQRIEHGPEDKIYDVDLTYLTRRGNWYFQSWKGDESKSGGIATNIGIHFFDVLGWIFGPIQKNVVHLHEKERAAGYLEYAKARVRWFLSVDVNDLPKTTRDEGKSSYRSIRIDNDELEFSSGFADLHTHSYENILDDRGFGIEETRQAIQIVHAIRTQSPIGLKGSYHPLARRPIRLTS